jgi:cystathionine beta-synthase
VDRWIKSNDRDSFRVARQLIRQEGLLVGGSSGAAVWAALQVGAGLGPGQRVVVLLPDSVRNYLTKFVDDTWMRRQGFGQAADWELGTVGDLVRALPRREVITAKVTDRLGDVLDRFKAHGISQLPVLDEERLAGIITEYDLLHQLVAGRVTRETPVVEAMVRKVSTVGMLTPSEELPRIFERGEVALVVDEHRTVLAILTKLDLIDLLATDKAVLPA